MSHDAAPSQIDVPKTSSDGARWLWRRDLTPRDWFGRPIPRAGRTTLALVAVSLVVQAIYWLSDGGALTDFPGDEERFIFLAFQILGHFGGVPAFTVHMPGWPLAIAALLKVFGYESLWVVGIYNRFLLAAMAGATFLILGRFMRRSIAVSVAVLSLTMGYNDRLATFVLTDLPYGAASLFAVAALLPGLASVRAGGRLGLAGLAIAAKTLLRPTGIFGAVCAAGVVLATTPGRAAARARRAVAVLVPVCSGAGGRHVQFRRG